MSIFVNSTEVESVFINGVEQNEVFVDGVEVFSSVPPMIAPETLPQTYCVLDSEFNVTIGSNPGQVQTWTSIIPMPPPSPYNVSMSGFGAQGQPFFTASDPNFNGRPSLNSTTTVQTMGGNILDPLVAFPFTFAFVYKYNNVGSTSNRMLGYGAVSGAPYNNGLVIAQDAANGLQFDFVNFGLPADNLAHIVFFTINGTQSQAWRDGIPGPIVNSATAAWIAFKLFGDNRGQFGMLGQIAAWSVYGAPLLTPAERNGIGLYYADRFGLPWTVS